ncbi:hypothetical protein GCM10010174_73400 [Kutzneria viridogrisea]|uniref:Uncharacterized protein n=1 Tax=Kutzneria viridogrisea TaxID=47990 RepID=A0ABR6BUU7_9PSEU|nr:hypothetical protein [Kutzneria viridogrisea]
MILRCRTNRGSTLPEDYRGLHYSEHTVFQLTPDRDYPAQGVGYFNGGVVVLVADDDAEPLWCSMDFFEVVDGSLAADWKFALRGDGPHGWEAVMGYPALAEDEQHHQGLNEERDADQQLFREQVARTTR